MIECKINKLCSLLLLLGCVIVQLTCARLSASTEPTALKVGLERLMRHEPAGTEALTKAISGLLKGLGIDEMYYPEKRSTNLATKIADNYKNLLPENPEDCISFLRSLALPLDTKTAITTVSAQAIEQAHAPGINNAKLLSFIVELFLVYQVQQILIQYYLKVHPELYEDDLDKKINATSLYMCSCGSASIPKRFALILYCVHDVQQRFTTKNTIVITSQNSGDLLMEYLIIRALQFVGYQKFTVNIIDQVYRVIGHPSKSAKERLAFINEFATRLHLGDPQIYKSEQSGIIHGVNVFGSANDYVELCQKRSAFKATVMTAVDAVMDGIPAEFAKPLVGKAETATKYRPLVNRVDISVVPFEEYRDVIIYMPRFCKPRVYWDRLLFSDEDRTASMKVIAALANTLEPLRSQDIDAYRKEFVDGVVNQIKVILAKEYTTGCEAFMQARIESKQPAPGEPSALSSEQIEQMVNERVKQARCEREKKSWDMILKYKMDTYVLFKELVHQTLRPYGVAYILGTNILQRINQKYLAIEQYYYSPFEVFGASDIRCILRSPEFIEQQL